MISEIMREYKMDNICKREYAKMMFSEYEKLFDYQVLFNNNHVEGIKISKDQIEVEMKYNEKEVKMHVYKKDIAAVTNTMLSFGDYENQEMDLTLKILGMLESDAVVFDVGANLGWYTLNISKNHPSFKIYSFEPVKETFDKLTRNFELNKIENAVPFNIGLNDRKGSMSFFYDVAASGASSFADLREEKTTRIVKCDFETLDDVADEIGISRLDFIKCDVEGAELMVYKGGIETIKKYKPVVFSEMLRKWSAKFDYHPNDIINLFSDMGYGCYVIENDKLKKFDVVTDETIETNYFFLHYDKHKVLISNLT